MSAELRIDLLTLFPGMIQGFLGESMLGKAVASGILQVQVHNIRDWAEDKHHVTDDRPFGGGAGMVLKPEPLAKALESVASPECTRIYLCPDGEPLNPTIARELATARHLVLLSGHYEGIDERIRERYIDREISIGDYVLTNGTLAAAVVIDAVSRYVPGVLGTEISLTQDSFQNNLLSFPQFTRPAEFSGMRVPEVLLSGNHGEIARWRKARQIDRTRARRPDLLQSHDPSTTLES